MKKNLKNTIAVFDSGVGGISVLKEMTALLPHEHFYFYGDSAHAPYGEKTVKEIRDLTIEIVNDMINKGAKAIVLACNTATSAAAEILRNIYTVPIIGVEPALKPATQADRHNRILVMATKNTLELEKFQKLADTYGKGIEIIPLACTGLAQCIEEGHLDDEILHQLLHSLLDEYVGNIDSVVLGCTHYPHIKDQILAILGDIPCFDGALGTARQLKNKLQEFDLLNDPSTIGTVTLDSSNPSPEEMALMKKLYEM